MYFAHEIRLTPTEHGVIHSLSSLLAINHFGLCSQTVFTLLSLFISLREQDAFSREIRRYQRFSGRILKTNETIGRGGTLFLVNEHGIPKV